METDEPAAAAEEEQLAKEVESKMQIESAGKRARSPRVDYKSLATDGTTEIPVPHAIEAPSSRIFEVPCLTLPC